MCEDKGAQLQQLAVSVSKSRDKLVIIGALTQIFTVCHACRLKKLSCGTTILLRQKLREEEGSVLLKVVGALQVGCEML